MSASPPGRHQKLVAATSLAKDGNYDGAIAALKELLAGEPNHELALGMLAGIYAQTGMHERAIEYFHRVLELNPSNALARFQLGLAQFSSGHQEQAIETWRPALSDTGDFLTHFCSGLALLYQGQPAEAQPLLETAARLMPKNHPLYPPVRELLAVLIGPMPA